LSNINEPTQEIVDGLPLVEQSVSSRNENQRMPREPESWWKIGLSVAGAVTAVAAFYLSYLTLNEVREQIKIQHDQTRILAEQSRRESILTTLELRTKLSPQVNIVRGQPYLGTELMDVEDNELVISVPLEIFNLGDRDMVWPNDSVTLRVFSCTTGHLVPSKHDGSTAQDGNRYDNNVTIIPPGSSSEAVVFKDFLEFPDTLNDISGRGKHVVVFRNVVYNRDALGISRDDREILRLDDQDGIFWFRGTERQEPFFAEPHFVEAWFRINEGRISLEDSVGCTEAEVMERQASVDRP